MLRRNFVDYLAKVPMLMAERMAMTKATTKTTVTSAALETFRYLAPIPAPVPVTLSHHVPTTNHATPSKPVPTAPKEQHEEHAQEVTATLEKETFPIAYVVED